MDICNDRVHFTGGTKNENGAGVNLNLTNEYQLCVFVHLRYSRVYDFISSLQQCFLRHKDNHERRLVKLLNNLLIV